MKFTCQKNELVQAIQLVSKAIANKPQTPILSGIYFETKDNQVELHATDNEMGIIATIPSEIAQEGKIVLSGRYMQEVIRRLPGETVTISQEFGENTSKIQSAASNFTFLSMPANDFPTVKPITDGVRFKIQDNVLRDIIKKTVFACSTDEARPVFTGCQLEINEETLKMAATNTHRLSVKKEVVANLSGDLHIIIPAKLLHELLRALNSDMPLEVDVCCSSNQAIFRFENVLFMSRLIEGQFPNYESVIPKSFATTVTLDTQAFLDAVDRVSLISRAADYNIIRLNFANDQVHISSNSPDIGNADEIVAASIEGPDVNIAFNAKYVTDVLKNLDSNTFRFLLNQSLQAAAVREEDNPTFVYIVTPVRTQN